jgi:ribose/xylose/arabinose/galactoside ABC-type transport system permease subunit
MTAARRTGIRIGGVMKANEFGIAIALILEIILFAFLSPYFLTGENLLNVSLQTSITAIIAAGMTLVILTGGIDLGVGAVVAVTGVAATMVLKLGLPLLPGFILAAAAGLFIGAGSGAVAGLLITKFDITPFIATMALMTIWRGTAYLLTDGRPIWELPPEFGLIANSRIFGLPLPTIVMVLVFVLAYIVLTRTPFGRYVYAIGGNSEAARLAGISVHRHLISVYIICGGLASVSGILLASRMNSGQPNAGLMYELDVIAAVVVGGTSLQGGRGSMVGTFIGAMLIGILRNGLNLLNVNSYVQMVVVGIVIVVAVMIDKLRTRTTH